MVQSLNWRLLANLGWWAFPIGIVAVFSMAGVFLVRLGVVKGFYASPLVLAVVIAALRSGRRGGYLAAILSTLTFNFVFVSPVLAFSIPTPEEMLAYISMFGAAYVVGGIRHNPPQSTDIDSYTGTLPFVRDNDDIKHRRSFWDVESVGVWLEDCTVGHQYARIYMARRQRYGAPVLSWIIRDMIKAGSYTGVEAGFVSAIAMYLPRQSAMALIAHDDTTQGDGH